MPKVRYEWDIETWDDADCLDHNHRDRLHDFGAEELLHAINQDVEPDGTVTKLVLVRDVGDEISGLTDRLWAYVTDDGKLPEFFSDGTDSVTSIRVPKHKHEEFNL